MTDEYNYLDICLTYSLCLFIKPKFSRHLLYERLAKKYYPEGES